MKALLRVVIGLLLIGFAAVTGSTPARADTLGYPDADTPCVWSPYKTSGTGYWCSGYSWGTKRDNDGPTSIYSPRGYAYRNCTDYVAWKLQSLGVSDDLTRGLGNGGEWYDNAASKAGLQRGTAPKVGAAAVVPSGTTGYGQYGHVAYVESVNTDGTITVSEYNGGLDGAGGTRTGKATSMHFTQFVYFGDHMTTPPENPGQGGTSSSSPTILALKRSTGPDGAREVYAATKDAVTEAYWFPNSDGVRSHTLFEPPDGPITGIDKTNLPDGVTQVLYTAVPTGVWETYWRPGMVKPSSYKVITGRTNVRQVIVDNRWIGGQYVHRVYALAQDGPFEQRWIDGGDGYHLQLLDPIPNPVAMAKSTATDGTDQLYVATATWVYELWGWPNNFGHAPLINIPQGDIRAVAKQNSPDGSQRLFTLTSTTVWRQSWGGGSFVTDAFVTGQSNTRTIRKTVTAGTDQLYLATADHVQEYYWNVPGTGGSGGSELFRTQWNDITAIDKSTDGGAQQLYTAAGAWIWETWWGGGASPSSTPLFRVTK